MSLYFPQDGDLNQKKRVSYFWFCNWQALQSLTQEYFYKSEICRSSTNMTKLISEQIKLKFAQSRNQYDLNLSLLSAKVS